MNQDLKIIKKKYGEAMMHFCRETFPTILEEEGKLSNLLLGHFAPSHELYYDIIKNNLVNNFKSFIYKLISVQENTIKVSKSPKELLSEAGYVLYECKSEKDIQKFKKYYAKGEELCTFNGGRLDYCRVFFAVKTNVDDIKRENFKKPERQDEYGTSVISIQFTKDDSHILSIKNRYNHTVQNPDATFSNNLDNIIPGLTVSFEKYYGIIQKHKSDIFEIPNYVLASDGKYYKYNQEVNNIYYCPDNIIIDNFEVKNYEKEKYIIMNYFVLDLQNKKIALYDKALEDGFIEGLQDIKDIKVEKSEEGRIIYITPNIGEIIEIELDKENNIIGYKNNNLIKIFDKYFLNKNTKLRKIECNNLEIISDYWLNYNLELTEISLPKVKEIGSYFIQSNQIINKVDLPNLEIAKMCFLYNNTDLEVLSLPKVKNIYSGFMLNNNKLIYLDLPSVENIGDSFLEENKTLRTFNAPNLRIADFNFLKNNKFMILKFIVNMLKVGKRVSFHTVCGFDFDYICYKFSDKKIKSRKIHK